MKLKIFVLIGMLLLAGVAAACLRQPSELSSKSEPKSDAAKETGEASPGIDQDSHEAGSRDEIPAAVKAVFSNAQAITKQHRDLTASQIASIEKDSGSKLGGTDFHTYIAYGTEGGKRVQLGAATTVDLKEDGEPIQLVVTYTNDITIKKVTVAEGNSFDFLTPAFLDQFAGKNQNQEFQIGKDIKYDGINRPAAEMVARSLKRDILAMQMLYGKPHTH